MAGQRQPPDDSQPVADDAQPAEEPTRIPPEEWVVWPVSDHSDLDRPVPRRYEDLSPAEQQQFDQAMAAQHVRDAAWDAAHAAAEAPPVSGQQPAPGQPAQAPEEQPQEPPQPPVQ